VAEEKIALRAKHLQVVASEIVMSSCRDYRTTFALYHWTLAKILRSVFVNLKKNAA
jgi:hypothetical protein